MLGHRTRDHEAALPGAIPGTGRRAPAAARRRGHRRPIPDGLPRRPPASAHRPRQQGRMSARVVREPALPPAGFRPQPRLRHRRDGRSSGSSPRLPAPAPRSSTSTPAGPPALRLAFAQAFADRTRPGGPSAPWRSQQDAYWRLPPFAGYLAAPVGRRRSRMTWSRPTWMGGSRNDHRWPRPSGVGRAQGRPAEYPGNHGPVRRHGCGPQGPLPAAQGVRSTYSRAEFARILAAARTDIRRAAERIRAGRDLLTSGAPASSTSRPTPAAGAGARAHLGGPDR